MIEREIYRYMIYSNIGITVVVMNTVVTTTHRKWIQNEAKQRNDIPNAEAT